jgi:autotransporter translocation and assembly factor TamB
MEPMRVVWAGLVVVVQAPAAAGGHWPAAAAEHDLVLHQVSAWLSGLRQGAQATPLLPAFSYTPVSPAGPAPAPGQQPEPPLPGFYL